MAIRTILTEGDPKLTKVCHPVTKFDQKLADLLDDMVETLEASGGVGLAAPQIGILRRAVVVDTGEEFLELVNPEVIETSGEQDGIEGCLSVPGISCEIERWSWVKVKCYDENFNEVIREGDGLFGRCMQHELDHLDGITLFERLSPLDRLAKLEEYKAAVERGAKPGEC